VLAAADLVHLPGGDPDLIPAILGGSAAWDAALQAFDRGACLAGASAGAMAFAERLWTARGPVDGLGVVRGVAVLPHFDGRRANEWRRIVDPDGRLAWLGLDERTLAIGPPGGPWTVAGAGRAHVFAPGGTTPVSAAAGERLGPPVG
jgi:cyanophycinase